MVGGDLATRYPLRMVAAILSKAMNISDWILSRARYFPYGEREVNIVLRQLERGRSPMTSSCGRVLDAISALLGICYERSYEGEPAMKLESTALRGEDVLRLDPKIDKDIIDTTHLIQEILHNRNSYPIADLAHSAEDYIARSLAELALDEASGIGLKDIGFSGGVAYNEHIASTIKRIVETNGLRFITHAQVPPGDGGISFGQAVAASNVL